VFCFN